MDKYEISLWEDYPVTLNGNTENEINYLDERKLAVIGSDTMMSQMRAVEPKMVTNINGTHTFTFKMYYWYTDEMTGEKRINPFGSLLINERKVKVKWNNEWYDMLIKNIDEDTSTRSMTYTCQDLYITELSKNGYELEFTADLQNNSGTASELAQHVLEGTSWHFDAESSTHILQKTEEPVYEVKLSRQITDAILQRPSYKGGDLNNQTIPAGKTILVFYSSILGATATPQQMDIQFLYDSEGYATEENDMLVTNGECYKLSNVWLRAIVNNDKQGIYYITTNNNNVTNSNKIAQFNSADDMSVRYRANRLVEVQKTAYDELFDRYVNVYENDIYGYVRTEYSDPTLITNLIANPNDFKNTDGWIGADLVWGAYPKFTTTSNITDYTCKSYLHVGTSKPLYNCGIDANQSFLKPLQGDIKDGITGGFHKGEAYILRIKAKVDAEDPSTSNYINTSFFTPKITTYTIENDEYISGDENYFTIDENMPIFVNNDKWLEYRMVCNKSISSEDLENYGIFFTNIQYAFWIEDVQFFKEAFGVTSYEEGAQTKRMNPGEVSLQGISKQIYRYYLKDHGSATKAEEVEFLYEGTEPSSEYISVTNDYEKITTIEAKNSNRFNILQSIAENFECWVRFKIEHDETGKVKIKQDENGQYIQEKYVTLVEYIGTDLGWSFEYGIDLKTIKRKIISDDIVTKVIVVPNENEFAPNGFCTIARSGLNYSKENFILNFDYYVNQGLLDRRTLDRDLYSSGTNWLGYYYYLHNWNKEYDSLTNILMQKNMEYTKQSSKLSLITDQLNAEIKKKESCEADIMTLACVTTWEAAQAYAREHADNKKVQSLMNARAQLVNQIDKDTIFKGQLESSVGELKNYIEAKSDRQSEIASDKKNLHAQFFKKYSRYLQEGTWQDGDYIDDDKYYLDAVDVAYTSSRPQIQYTIDVMRLSSLDDYMPKTFSVGDICYIQDREYFGYGADGITPYKLKIIISEITSYLDQPEKDQIKVQNYKTQFDDLFQRITATTQSLQYAQGGYEKAAGVINHDKTLSFDLLQDTFDYNENWVLNSSGQHVTWDDTGLTVTDDRNAGLQVKLMAGGLFITNDGGASWKNAIRGDGISADVLTAGRINTSEIFVYDGNNPSFRWDSDGINAYYNYMDQDASVTDFGKYVRIDRFGIYGYKGNGDFVPATEEEIWYKYEGTEKYPNNDVRFGLTWKGFFLHGDSGISSLEIKSEEDSDGISQIRFIMTSESKAGAADAIESDKVNCSLEISTDNDIILKTGEIPRIQIGRFKATKIEDGEPVEYIADYGIWVRDADGNNVFNVSANGVDSIGGWNLTQDSFYHYTEDLGTIGLYSSGRVWTILGPESSSTDEESIGQSQTGKNELDDERTEEDEGDDVDVGRPNKENGYTDKYYIIAGNKFGVTVDGNIYAAGGRIGGWEITNQYLHSSHIDNSDSKRHHIYIWSDGHLKCIADENTTDIAHPDYIENDEYRLNRYKYILGSNALVQIECTNPLTPNGYSIYYARLSEEEGIILSYVNITSYTSLEQTEKKTITIFNSFLENCSPGAVNFYIEITGSNKKIFIGALGVQYIPDSEWGDDTGGGGGTQPSAVYTLLSNEYIKGSTDTFIINTALTFYGYVCINTSEPDINDWSTYSNITLGQDLNSNYSYNLENFTFTINSTYMNNNRFVINNSYNVYVFDSIEGWKNIGQVTFISANSSGEESGDDIIVDDNSASTQDNNQNEESDQQDVLETNAMETDPDVADRTLMWDITESGKAYFRNIKAKGGYIAGWHIDEDCIWNDTGTYLSAGGNATYNVQQYTIVTNSISASGGSIGGVGISSGGLTFASGANMHFGNETVYLDNLAYVSGICADLTPEAHTGTVTIWSGGKQVGSGSYTYYTYSLSGRVYTRRTRVLKTADYEPGFTTINSCGIN